MSLGTAPRLTSAIDCAHGRRRRTASSPSAA
jgi:hypothetical protein